MAGFEKPAVPMRKGPRRSRKKPRPAYRPDEDKTSSDSLKLSSTMTDSNNLDDLRTRQTAQGWRDWLKKQPTPQQKHPKPATDASTSDVATVSTVKPHETALYDADQSYADVENDIIETEKERIMQTAKQDNSIIETDCAVKVDLRDTPSAKVNALKDSAKPIADDEMGSLFGPAIEDDVKGVRNQIRELIQCEMQGELGQRFSRNLRIVIRREIAAAIDDQFDRV